MTIRCLTFVLGLIAATAVPAGGQNGPPIQGVTRVYVEPFAARPASDKLRESLIAQLRKLHAISLAATASAADARLVGEGEAWIKAYQSLNPRSGRLSSNGTPIYGGFLSVELIDAHGDTLWSYLASESSSDDLFTTLAKRTVKHLDEALGHRSGR